MSGQELAGQPDLGRLLVSHVAVPYRPYPGRRSTSTRASKRGRAYRASDCESVCRRA